VAATDEQPMLFFLKEKKKKKKNTLGLPDILLPQAFSAKQPLEAEKNDCHNVPRKMGGPGWGGGGAKQQNRR
jgi:hypothetical protein